MVIKIKSNLFKILKKGYYFFKKTNFHKIIPFRKRLFDFLFWNFWPYGEIIEIQGSKMYLNVWDKDLVMRKTFRAYAFNRIHEENTTNLFKKSCKKGDVIVDLGANIGYFTLLAARLVGEKGRVYAFEPEPKNFNYLLKNVKLNSYHNVTCIQKAVSNFTGKTKLFICPYDSGHHTINQYEGIRNYKPELLSKNNREEFIEVETTTLDDFFRGKEQSIDLIKMDVEGAEMLILLGMEEVIQKSKNLKMFIEFFPLLIKKMGNSPEEFIRKLLRYYRFSVFIIPGDYNVFKGKLIKIQKVNEIMNFCKGEKDHLNLFVKKD